MVSSGAAEQVLETLCDKNVKMSKREEEAREREIMVTYKKSVEALVSVIEEASMDHLESPMAAAHYRELCRRRNLWSKAEVNFSGVQEKKNVEDSLRLQEKCGLCLELLFARIDPTHPLRGVSPPLHLNEDIGSSEKPTGGSLTLPSTPFLFSGLNVGDWFLWRQRAERDILRNVAFSDEVKFDHLLARLQPGSPAFRMVYSYGGVPTGFMLAWDALTKKYGDFTILRRYHIDKLAELPRWAIITSGEAVGSQIQRLLEKVRQHTSILSALGEERGHLESVAHTAVLACLPLPLKLNYYRDVEQLNAQDTLPVVLNFLEGEAEVWRKAVGSNRFVTLTGQRTLPQRPQPGWFRGTARVPRGQATYRPARPSLVRSVRTAAETTVRPSDPNEL